jgi:hypothetical protein
MRRGRSVPPRHFAAISPREIRARAEAVAVLDAAGDLQARIVMVRFDLDRVGSQPAVAR